MSPLAAIVIGRFDLGEADRIVTLFTRERGKLRASARGVRRIKSRLAGHVELFSQAEIWLHDGKTLDSITDARLKRGAGNWIHRTDRVSLAYLMAQLLDRLSTEGEAQPELYDLAIELLDCLETSAEAAPLELGLKLRFLNDLGYRPELSSCTICGEASADTEYYLNHERGGIVCAACNVGGYPMDQRAIKFWRMALELPLASLALIAGAEQLSVATLELLDGFYEYHFGRRFTGQPLGV